MSILRALPWVLGLGAAAGATAPSTNTRASIRWGLVILTAACFGFWQGDPWAGGFATGAVLLCIQYRRR